MQVTTQQNKKQKPKPKTKQKLPQRKNQKPYPDYSKRESTTNTASDKVYSYGKSPKQSNTGKDLEAVLRKLQGKPYQFYKDLLNTEWYFSDFTLYFDRIQNDPYASPSILRARIALSEVRIPFKFYSNKIRTIASCDFLTRFFAQVCRVKDYGVTEAEKKAEWSAEKGGSLQVSRPGAYVLERSSVTITVETSNQENVMNEPAKGYVEVRFSCNLPGYKRQISGLRCADVICTRFVEVLYGSIMYQKYSKDPKLIEEKSAEFEIHVKSVENEEYLRQVLLPKMDAVAFIRDGSILPRESGVSDLPLSREKAIPFVVDKKDVLYREVELPHSVPVLFYTQHDDGSFSFTTQFTKKIAGLIIPRGVTIIVGGGFHGKTTLLSCIEFGIYNHNPGDGREYCVSDPTAFKIRAEDGRYVVGVNISPFIGHLPLQRKDATKSFSSPNASGSTSQAACICEALEVGTRCLLMDEDTCATNLMIRDILMPKIVGHDKEPITPLISKIRCLYNELNVSSVLVIGGCGSYFYVADNVIMMDNYMPKNVTQKTKDIIGGPMSVDVDMKEKEANNVRLVNGLPQFNSFGEITNRIPNPSSIDPTRKGCIQFTFKHDDKIGIGWSMIDLAAISQIVEKSQANTIAYALVYLHQNYMKHCKMNIRELMQQIQKDMDKRGLDVLTGVDETSFTVGLIPDLVRPRTLEIAAALNRLRTLQIM